MSPKPRQLPAETLQAAQSLWRTAVAANGSPTVSIRAGGVAPAREAAASRVKLRPHNLQAAGQAAPAGAPDADFNLLRLLGRGGMGVVYSARQLSLDREIALKMLRPDEAPTADATDKFLAEAVVTGVLDHPNVVPIYDVGRAPDGSIFYAMKEVTGTCWAQALPNKSTDENLRIFLSVCDAVAFAHDKGLIHRDLKPENVMLGAYGEVFVMDWGLAASVGSDRAARLTPDSGLAGTPACMAPEMALCEVDRIGRASDIYLLGGILYEIATGLKPHPGTDVYACIAAAMDNVIQPTDRKDELVSLALKALALRPEDRFGTVQEFLAAVRSYQAHAESLKLSAASEERRVNMIKADEDSVYREATEIIAGYQQALKLWNDNAAAAVGLRRTRESFVGIALDRGDLALAKSQVTAMATEHRAHPVQAEDAIPLEALFARVSAALASARRRERLVRVSATVAILAGLAALGITGVAYRLTRQERDRALASRAAAMADRDRALAAEARVDALRQKAEAALRRADEENYVNLIALAERRVAEAAMAEAESLLWSAPASQRGWEWGWLLFLCHRELIACEGHSEPPFAVAFSPDGSRLVTVALDNQIIVWDVRTGRPTATLQTEAAPILALTFSADGLQVLAALRTGQVRAWKVNTRDDARSVLLAVPPHEAALAAFSADGRFVGAVTAKGQVGVWDLASGRGVPTAPVSSAMADGAAFGLSAGAQHGVLAGNGRDLQLWDLPTGGRTVALAPADLAPPVLGVAFSRDGTRLATAGADRTVRLRDAETGETLLTLGGHNDRVAAVAFAPDDRFVATASYDKTARIWDAHCWGQLLDMKGHTAPVSSAAFSTDGRYALTAGEDKTARIWDAQTGQMTAMLRGHADSVEAAVFSPDGASVYTGSRDGTVRAWDAHSGRERPPLGAGGEAVTSVAVAPDGRRLVTAGKRGAKVWDLPGGRETASIRSDAGVSQYARFSPDGARLLLAGREAAIWNTQNGRKLMELGGHLGSVACAVFSPDGKRVVTGDRRGARLWDAESGRELLGLGRDAGAVSCAAFSPDGRRILTGGQSQLKVWNAETGRELLSLHAHAGWITAVQFSSDGRRLITAGDDRLAKIWAAFAPGIEPKDVSTQERTLFDPILAGK